MSGRFTVGPLLDELSSQANRLVREVDRVLLSDRVPTCPQWTVRDLVGHLGGVHRWATTIVEGAHQHDLPAAEKAVLFEVPPDAGSMASLMEWFKSGADRLVEVLRVAPEDLLAFVFLKNAPPARHFWARRQAHETAIHRIDALSVRLGRMPSTAEADIDGAFAVDGIDELIRGFVPRRSGLLRTDEPFQVTIAPTDVDVSWTVLVSDQPAVVTTAADGAARGSQARLTGTAAALYLGLWNRGDDIAETGTVDALGHWREQVRVRWA